MIQVGDFVRLKHAPRWDGFVSSTTGDTAVVKPFNCSDIPDAGGWMLPIALLEKIV